MQLEFSNEGETMEMTTLQEVQRRLKRSIHIESEIINELEDSMGVFESDGHALSEYALDQLEEVGDTIVNYLRRLNGIFEVDYKLGDEYPIELVIMFE